MDSQSEKNFSNELQLIQRKNHHNNNNFQVQPSRMNQKEDEYMQIEDLEPGEDFIIKVRVSKKGQVQEYWKESLPSKRLTITLEDRNGDEINATLFDYYDDFIREGKVYLMEGGLVNETPERFRQ